MFSNLVHFDTACLLTLLLQLQQERGAPPPVVQTPSHALVLLHCFKHVWHTTTKLTAQRDVIDRLEDLVTELLGDPTKADMTFTLSMPGTPPAGGHQTAAGTPSHTGRVGGAFPFASNSGIITADAGATALSTALTARGGGLTSTRSSFRMPPSKQQSTAGVLMGATGMRGRQKPPLIAKAYFCLAQWRQATAGKSLNQDTVRCRSGGSKSDCTTALLLYVPRHLHVAFCVRSSSPSDGATHKCSVSLLAQPSCNMSKACRLTRSLHCTRRLSTMLALAGARSGTSMASSA